MTKKVSTQDSELFRQTVGNIIPVAKQDTVLRQPKPRNPPSRNHLLPLAIDTLSDSQLVASEDRLFFARPNLAKSIINALKRGKLRSEDSCDLHGLTQAQAQQYLQQFIQESLAQQLSVVHIIHGKGHHSDEPHPVIKNLVNYQLRRYPVIQAFCSCTTQDGGTGAIYVILEA